MTAASCWMPEWSQVASSEGGAGVDCSAAGLARCIPSCAGAQVSATDMQEMNLSETAYIQPVSDRTEGDLFVTCGRFTLRWFTPMDEVALCGHATLASAAALFQGAVTPAFSSSYSRGQFHVRYCVWNRWGLRNDDHWPSYNVASNILCVRLNQLGAHHLKYRPPLPRWIWGC